MTTFGTRLNEERLRLGLTQASMSELGNVTQNTQRAYEQDKQTPSAAYLQRLMAHGLDVMYLFHAVRFGVLAAKETEEMLVAMSQLTESQREAAVALLSSFAKASVMEQKQLGETTESFWRAARFFALFVELSEKEQLVLELTAGNLRTMR